MANGKLTPSEIADLKARLLKERDELDEQLSTIEDYEVLIAWGREMALDTRFGSPETVPPGGPPRRLIDISRQLIGRYPAIGPIFA